ncbi:unnamed protein product [Clonostachys chloroleuca]|uniref:Uncharacterized protein n=1 Tax=Clonostachys chloroleuca TaxID=1926264 RepID=A0AA35M740_9HYPO|nr:unnamed protein product [Clonostachys chloroleuca]
MLEDQLTRSNHCRIQSTILLEWLSSQNLTMGKPHMRQPCLLKKGSIFTSDGEVAMLIPLPFDLCEVQYQSKKDDRTTRESLEWRNPILLPENSRVVLLSGSIKFIMIDIDVEKTNLDHDSNGDGKGLVEK